MARRVSTALRKGRGCRTRPTPAQQRYLGRNVAMQSKIARLLGVVGILALAGGAPGGSALSADELDPISTNSLLPPQTLPRGFESTGDLLRDQEEAGKAPLYSAWLVESSRFVDVPPGSFMPDRAFIPGSTDPRHNIPFLTFQPMSESSRAKTARSPCMTAAGSSWRTSMIGTPRAAGGTSPTR